MANKAELVKTLRAATQAGMSDCLKALTECNDDIEAAQKWLREKGMAKANKKAGAVAYEGITKAGVKAKKALIVEINSQTDFMAKNEQFLKLCDDIFNSILDQANNTKEIESVKVNGKSINDACMELTATTGEKIILRRAEIINVGDNETLGCYTHSNNKISTLILIKNKVSDEVAKDVAMHTAAMAPKYLDSTQVDKTWLDSEAEVLRNQFKEELANISNEKAKAEKAKREDIIVEGKIKKTLKEICLVDQPYVKDSSVTVSQFVKNNGGELINMIRFELGEGIQKKSENFADEVAAQMK